MEKALPIPEIINISLIRREADIGELLIEYKLPEIPNIPISGVVVFLRPVRDPLNFPEPKIKRYLAGDLTENDIHYTFLPPKRGRNAQIQVLVPLYVTFKAGIATYKLHEHSENIILSEDNPLTTLESNQSFRLSPIKPIKKTFPEGLKLNKHGTLRVEIEPDEEDDLSFLEEQVLGFKQQFRLSETFVDHFLTTKYIDTIKSQNIDLVNRNINNFRIKPQDQSLKDRAAVLIEGLKATEPTTQFIPFPLEAPEVYKYRFLSWEGENVKVYISTGTNAGEVSENENFREAKNGRDINSYPNEDTLNVRVDFLANNAYIKNLTIHYSEYEPAIFYTKPIPAENVFNQAAVAFDAGNFDKVFISASNDSGRTFKDPEPGEGIDLFSFDELGNDIIVKIEIFGDNYIDGFGFCSGLKPEIPPEPLEGADPQEF